MSRSVIFTQTTNRDPSRLTTVPEPAKLNGVILVWGPGRRQAKGGNDDSGNGRGSSDQIVRTNRGGGPRRRSRHYSAKSTCGKAGTGPHAGQAPTTIWQCKRAHRVHGAGLRRSPGGLQRLHAMKLLLDTHAFLWMVNGDSNLSAAARTLIQDPSNEPMLSIVSLWEIAIKASIGKLTLAEPYSVSMPRETLPYDILPISLAHTTAVASLP